MSNTTKTRNYTMTGGGWIGLGDAVKANISAGGAKSLAEAGLTRQEDIREALASAVQECVDTAVDNLIKEAQANADTFKAQIEAKRARAAAIRGLVGAGMSEAQATKVVDDIKAS